LLLAQAEVLGREQDVAQVVLRGERLGEHHQLAASLTAPAARQDQPHRLDELARLAVVGEAGQALGAEGEAAHALPLGLDPGARGRRRLVALWRLDARLSGEAAEVLLEVDRELEAELTDL